MFVLKLLWLFAPMALQAEPVINEVLANEPGSSTSLEWIELYNGDASVCLDGYSVKIGDNLIELPADVTLSEGEYFVVCRRLYANSSSPGFESYWGDSSGVWGDTPYEESLPTPFEVAMSLTNDTGCVELLGGGTVIGSFTWNKSGLDGYSWERLEYDRDSIAQSIDLAGSTPGFLNSVTPVEYDLAITDVIVEPVDGATHLTFEVSNVGRETMPASSLYLTNSQANPIDTIDIIEIGSVGTGEVVVAKRESVFSGMYVPLAAGLSDDDRERNNVIEFMAVGQEYPPVILSEFLANPQDDLSGEWVEIRNRSAYDVDLSQWFIGDALRVNPICDESVILQTGDYAVLVQDSVGFLTFYGSTFLACIEPSSWASLNNDADMVRLVDSYGIEADRFGYETVYGANYTWCRVDDELASRQWGRSENVGGSPGESNNVILAQEASGLDVTIEPLYVSPDGDGFEDIAFIKISAPFADSYTVRVYDRQGRVVRRIIEEESMIPSEIQWNGLSDAGHRLPVGIYIVYVEACGVESVKKPVVVAR